MRYYFSFNYFCKKKRIKQKCAFLDFKICIYAIEITSENRFK